MDAKTPIIFLDVDTPLVSAKLFHQRVRPHLIKQNGIWYDYAGTHYKEIEDATVKSAVQTWMGKASVPNKAGKLIPLNPQPYDVRYVVEFLEGLPEVHKPAATYKSPSWLNDDDSNPRAIIPCLNGLLDIESRELRPHTPDFFCVYCLGLEYKPDVPVPQAWLEFLDQTYNGRQHLIDALQEAFGYMISGDRSHEKIFYHIGRVRSGKGVVQTVSRHLVGEKNAVSMSFGGGESTLGDKHGLAGAENALLIQIPDISVGKTSRGACTRLKEISGGDPVPVRPLYARATTMILPGVIQCGSNGIPNFGADADALAARLLFWDHRNQVEANKRDLTLKDPRKSALLSVEALTGILNWSLAGLDRLNGRGYFEEWPESRDVKRLMLRESNPIVAFLDAHCEWGADASVETTVLHHVYRDYCASQGIGYKIENHFGQALRLAAQALGIVLDMHQPRTKGGRIREWSGVGLNCTNLVEYHQHDPDAVGLSPDGPSIETLIMGPDGRLIARPWDAPDGERDYTHAFDDGGEDD